MDVSRGSAFGQVVSAVDVLMLVSTCSDKIPFLEKRTSELSDKYVSLKVMYQRKSGGTAWGQQRTQLTKASEALSLARRAHTSCKEMKVTLEAEKHIDGVLAVEMMGTVKLVFIQLRLAASEYFVALLQFNNGLTIFSVARLFIDSSFKNAQLKKILSDISKGVKEATDGCVKVILNATDGKHRSLQENNLQSLARDASRVVKLRLRCNGEPSQTHVAQAQKLVDATTLALGSNTRPTKGEPAYYCSFAVPFLKK